MSSNEHFFAVTSKHVPAAVANKRDRIAREVGGDGCGYTSIHLPGEGARAWGFAPNHGEPFDSATAAAITAAWEAAGVGLQKAGGRV